MFILWCRLTGEKLPDKSFIKNYFTLPQVSFWLLPLTRAFVKKFLISNNLTLIFVMLIKSWIINASCKYQLNACCSCYQYCMTKVCKGKLDKARERERENEEVRRLSQKRVDTSQCFYCSKIVPSWSHEFLNSVKRESNPNSVLSLLDISA